MPMSARKNYIGGFLSAASKAGATAGKRALRLFTASLKTITIKH